MIHKTYRDIQEQVSRNLDISAASVKTCWIAEVKRSHGMTKRIAPNRGNGKGAPPCPQNYWNAIQKALLSE